MRSTDVPPGFSDMRSVSLVDAILGRRSRRFFMGANIPDGVFQYESTAVPLPLSELETYLVVGACSGNTSWHHMIFRGERYAPHLANYAGSAGGRTFPSSAGFETSQTFFTDDRGVYLVEMRDAPAFADRADDGSLDLDGFVDYVRLRTRRLQEGRLRVPSEVPYTEAHNTWVFNKPSTLLVIPVADLSLHVLMGLCYMLQNGLVLYDDVHGRSIPGIDEFSDGIGPGPVSIWPLTFLEQSALSEVSVELGTSCYAGALMLQAMGLGGWMYNGVDPFAVLGASGDPNVPGLGFRYDNDDRWPYPNPTGLAGVMEGFCPPHHPTMRAAVDAVCERKFGLGGPFHPQTPGPWKDSRRVRSAAQVHDERFRECVALQAQYIYDTFGKFPATVPSMFISTYLQAHHLDLEFYDRFFKPGAYLATHMRHAAQWHVGETSQPQRVRSHSHGGEGGRTVEVGDRARVISLCDSRDLCDHELVGREGTVVAIAFGPEQWPIRVRFDDGQTREFEPEELESADAPIGPDAWASKTCLDEK